MAILGGGSGADGASSASKVEASGLAAAVYEYIAPLAPISTRDEDERVRCAQSRLLAFWPKRFTAEYGIMRALALRRAPPSLPPLEAGRRSLTLAETAAQVNDSLDAPAELARVFAKHATIDRTKTRDDFAMLTDWVRRQQDGLRRAPRWAPAGAALGSGGRRVAHARHCSRGPLPSLSVLMHPRGRQVRHLSPRLFKEHSTAGGPLGRPSVVERMSALLCATWSDKAALLQLCQAFGSMLLTCTEATSDVTPLVRFLRKCGPPSCNAEQRRALSGCPLTSGLPASARPCNRTDGALLACRECHEDGSCVPSLIVRPPDAAIWAPRNSSSSTACRLSHPCMLAAPLRCTC